MPNTYQYIEAPEILDLVSKFNSYLTENGIKDFNDSKHKNLRGLMIDYFKSEEFYENYSKIAIAILKRLDLDPNSAMLQKVPTPRIFRPGDHGTSFHSDYWYGHGEKTITVWTPLSEIQVGNSFSIIPDAGLNEKFIQILGENFGAASPDQERELLTLSDPVIMPLGTSVTFPSKILHGSPKNITNKVRVSFDFRIANLEDKSSTKDPESYFVWNGSFFVAPPNRFTDLNFIKYICGGEQKNTIAQHLIIESVVKEYGINISGQEAEVERFGHPIFKAYLDHLAKAKNIDGLVIASKNILDAKSIEEAINHNEIKIYCALENEFL